MAGVIRGPIPAFDRVRPAIDRGVRTVAGGAPTITYPLAGNVADAEIAVVVSAPSAVSVSVAVDGTPYETTEAPTGTFTATVPLAIGASTIVATASYASGGPLVSDPVTVVRGALQIDAEGVEAAQVIGLRALLKARKSFTGLPTTVPTSGTAYFAYCWIGETEVHARSYPGLYTPAFVRPIFDAFINTVGGNGTYPDSPADLLYPNGTWRYFDAQTARPVLQTPPGIALLAAMLHWRGDATVYTTHKAKIDRALESVMRDGTNGLPMTDGGTIGWGYEDIDRPVGTPAFIGAMYAWAYRELAAVAADAGDAAGAADYAAKRDATITGLQSLRRPDGFYNISDVESGRHLAATCLIASRSLCTPEEEAATVTAIRNAYLAGNSLYRGALRLLVYQDYYLRGGQNTYQNGGYWPGPWAGWCAQALAAHGHTTEATEIIQAAMDEFHREHRASGLAPYEWIYPTGTGGTSLYGVAAATMEAANDTTPASFSAVLEGGAGTSVTVACSRGHLGRKITATATAPVTAVLNVYGQPHTNTLWGEADAAKFATYGTEVLIGTISLSDATSGETTGVVPTGAAFGGRLRFEIGSGTVASPGVTVALAAVATEAELVEETPTIYDDYESDNLATDYTVVLGSWSIAGGKLQYSQAADFAKVTRNGSSGTTQVVHATVSSTNYSYRKPGLMCRYTDANNTLLCYMEGTVVIIGQLVSGAWTELGRPSFVALAGSTHTLMMAASGSSVRLYVDGALTGTYTTTKTTAGLVGAYCAFAAGTATASWLDLRYFATGLPEVPPGYVLDLGGTSAYVSGEVAPHIAGAAVLRSADGTAVSTLTPTALARISY